MTYPMIGNYGIAPEDFESGKTYLSALIVKEPSRIASNWRHERSLDQYLAEHDVPGFCELDTRALVRHLRDAGAQRGVIADAKHSTAELIERAKAIPSMAGLDLASRVMTQKAYTWQRSTLDLTGNDKKRDAKFHVVVYDFGVKRNILRSLVHFGARVTVVPGTMDAAEVLAMKPDGVVFSNGPGDPEPLTYAIDNARALLGKTPVFGICLGHQILSLAAGAKTFKLKFGHHGANHPVMDLTTNKVEITSQNHGFAVDPESLPASRAELTHVNLNDKTVAGIRIKDAPAFSVQYHPEAAPGPRDAGYLFERFADAMDDFKKRAR
jgi:carbamoyl-phosphate synthase small subunit